MVNKCRRAGVRVYVDPVINHMTGQGHTSYGGVDYKPYNYPDYNLSDFHVKIGECPSSDGGIQDFNNKLQVFKCNRVGLEDLRIETDKVEETLAAYPNKLIGYGISGFRVDAAKHVGQDDLDAIYARLNKTKDGVKPYWALEGFGGGPGILSPEAFTRSGDVLGLDAAKQIQAAFKSYPDAHVGSLATLEVFGEGSGLTSSKKTMSFVTNHDTDRNPGEYLGHKDGATFILANKRSGICLEEMRNAGGIFLRRYCCWTKPRTMRCGCARVRHGASTLAAHLRSDRPRHHDPDLLPAPTAGMRPSRRIAGRPAWPLQSGGERGRYYRSGRTAPGPHPDRRPYGANPWRYTPNWLLRALHKDPAVWGSNESSTLSLDSRSPRLSSIETQYKTFERSVPHISIQLWPAGTLSTGSTRF
jgi:hypothetical protein